MAKNDAKVSKKDEYGVPQSKSQRRKKERKGGVQKQYGGTCSSCGQVSMSSSTNTPHDHCRGYVESTSEKLYDFKDPILNRLGEQVAMRADGSVVSGWLGGRWISSDELQVRRVKNVEKHLNDAKSKIIMTSVFKPKIAENSKLGVVGKDDVDCEMIFSHLDVTNGLGEPLNWIGGAWRTEEQMLAYAIEIEEGKLIAANDNLDKGGVASIEEMAA